MVEEVQLLVLVELLEEHLQELAAAMAVEVVAEFVHSKVLVAGLVLEDILVLAVKAGLRLIVIMEMAAQVVVAVVVAALAMLEALVVLVAVE